MAIPMPSDARPNVIFFMVDQLSACWLEAALAGACGLPNLQRLQRMGVTFSNAFANNPVCCPARASIATGLTSRGHGLMSNGYRLNPDIPTFMRTLQTAGWRTGAFGKVHFYPFDSEQYPYPDYREYGWDVTHVTEDNRTGEWLDWIEREHAEHYEAVLATPANWAPQLPYYAAYGERRINLSERVRQAKEKMSWPDQADGGLHSRTEGFYPLPFPEEISQTNWITDRALDFIDDTPAGQPLYAHISYVQPHSPFHPPARFVAQVNAELIPDPAGYHTEHWPTPEQVPQWRYMRKLYFADLMHIDEQLGRILARLQQAGVLANTFLFFTSDHGEMLMDHGLMGKSSYHYDACIRVPLIIAGSGLGRQGRTASPNATDSPVHRDSSDSLQPAQGQVCDLPVQHEDLCPTVLDVADGLPACHPRPPVRPWLQEEPQLFAGRSLMPLCRGEQPSDWRTSVFAESSGALCESPFCTQLREFPWVKTLRTAEFRYTVAPGRDEGEQLFDLRKDPQEQVNVVSDPAYQQARAGLMKDLMHRVMLQDYPLPPRDLVVIGAH